MKNKKEWENSSFLTILLISFFIAFFFLLFVCEVTPAHKGNIIDSVMAASAFVIPITLGWMQYKTEKGRERLEQSNKETIIAMEAKLEEMRKLQTSLETKQKEMKKLQADAEQTLEAIKKVKIMNSNIDISSKGTSLNLRNATIGDML